MLLAVAARLTAVFEASWAAPSLALAAIGWVGAFGLFIVLYGPMLVRPKS